MLSQKPKKTALAIAVWMACAGAGAHERGSRSGEGGERQALSGGGQAERPQGKWRGRDDHGSRRGDGHHRHGNRGARPGPKPIPLPEPVPKPSPAPLPAPLPEDPEKPGHHLYVSASGSDSNPGTRAKPFKTIKKAEAAASAGTVVHVAPGAYAVGVTRKGGRPGAPIRYVSDQRWGAKIISSKWEALWDVRGNDVEVAGFLFDGGTSREVTTGIYLGGSRNVARDNLVQNIARSIPCSSKGAAGIKTDNYYHGVDNDVISNVVRHIGSNKCHFFQGIYLSTPGVAANNLVHGVSSSGITSWHNATRVKVINNTVFGNKFGITIGAGDYYHGSSAPNDYSVVANNIVYDNWTHGIDEQGRTGTRNAYVNNLSFKNGRDWRLLNGLKASGSISKDPQFVDYKADGTGDYRLRAGSPAIDRGSRSYSPPLDLAGVSRALGAGPDLGALERAR